MKKITNICFNSFSQEKPKELLKDSLKLMESFDGTDADLMRNILQKQVGNNDRSYSDILHLLIAKHIKVTS